MEPLRVKVELQALGVRVPPELFRRAGGAGPADGVTVFMGGLSATVPATAPYAQRSPYAISRDGGVWALFRKGEFLFEVQPAPAPAFYGMSTPSGVGYKSIAIRHGKDAVGSTVVQWCCRRGDSCRFCAISASAASGATKPRKDPRELAEVAAAARGEGYRHVVLTTGTTAGADRGSRYLAECARAVKESAGLAVHVQFEPPDDLVFIERAAAAADTVAINIECFDRRVLEEVAPGKAGTSLDAYIRSWKKAVEVFGPGQVVCFLIAGLGEDPSSILEGSRLLCSLGVYPFVLPFRPIPGTPLGDLEPPGADEMLAVYEEVSDVVREAGLKAADCLAGCVRCGACSAMTDYTG